MTETYDVTLDSVGYMVKPGAYQRYQDGQSDGRLGRVRLFDFYGGANRTAQLERDRFLGGAGAWPTLDSQGIIAGPVETDRTVTPATAIDPSNRMWSFGYDGDVYVVSGSGLYQVSTSGGGFDDLTLIQTLSADVVDCCLVNAKMYFVYGSAANGSRYDLDSSTWTADAISGKADLCGGEGSYVMLRKNGYPYSVYVGSVAGSSYTLGSDLMRFVSVNGHLWMLCRSAIYRWTAFNEFTPEASTPYMSADDDYAWAVAHFGRLWVWAGKEILYYDTTDNEFKGTGIRGQGTLGACTVGSAGLSASSKT